MSAGIEPLKTCIRIWWKQNGKLHRETLKDTPPTEANLAHAKKLAASIAAQLELGTFDREQTFPNSTKKRESYFGHYIKQWQVKEQILVSTSSWDTYQSKVDNHITPYWQHKQINKINADDVEQWVYGELIANKGLASKTVKDIIGHWRKIYSYWARHQAHVNDPAQYIRLNQKDPDDIHPFTKAEIKLIINCESDPTLKNLWTVMLWSGLSSHELMPLAVSDINWHNQTAYIQRGHVKNNYRVTKNRRRKRHIELLPIVINALESQAKIVASNKPQTVVITERDHRTKIKQDLQFFWYCQSTNTHYNYEQLRHIWKDHLIRIGVKYRPLNNGRHTYASQVLSTGVITAEWLANQLGHANTQMIHKHYGKFIPEDSGHIIKILTNALNLHT